MDHSPTHPHNNGRPVGLLLDTDMGNDIDDALALAMIHGLQSCGECALLGVALSKDSVYAPAYVDIVNTFYGRGEIPVGVVEDGVTRDDGKFIKEVVELTDNGAPRYARTHKDGEYPEAVAMMRGLLAAEPDRSVVPVMIGFSTNMARLLDSPPDQINELNGHDLFKKKVSHVVMMAADFSDGVRSNPTIETREYNVLKDIPSAKAFIANCPRPIVFTGVEVGRVLMYPGSTTGDLYNWAPHHPVADAYGFYRKLPYDRPTWDLTAVLEAVRPQGGYFERSEPGVVVVSDDGCVRFQPDPNGNHRYLTIAEDQHERIVKSMVELVTQPTRQAAIKITATMATQPRRAAQVWSASTNQLVTGARGRGADTP